MPSPADGARRSSRSIAHSIVAGSAWAPTPWGRGPAGGVGGVEQTGAMTGDVRSVRKG
jgi:hypothetical protein